MKFSEINLEKNLLKGIEDAGFTDLMPVQEETLKYSMSGKDVCVQSQTGTGKTAAFLITIFQHHQDMKRTHNKKALIITPTRELAVQIEKDARLLGGRLQLIIGSFYGGVGYKRQEKLLKDGVEVIIGTPGRLLDFNSQGKVNFKEIGFLVIDEADRMLDMGFFPDIKRILKNASISAKRQTMLFSATLDSKTKDLARQFMNQPVSIAIRPEEITVDNISQTIYHVSRREKINLLLGILKNEAPKNALIFTNMKSESVQVSKHLKNNGLQCSFLNGDLAQSKRLQVIDHFKTGKIPILVATDVAARGLHIEDLEMIINYDLPGDCENYVHRIGRTARAGKSGKAISLACEKNIHNLEAIESFLNKKIPVGFATDDMFLENKSKDMGLSFKRRNGNKNRNHKNLTSGKKKFYSKYSNPHKKSNKYQSSSLKRKKTGPGKDKIPAKPRNGTAEERLTYYKKKYGDRFIRTDSQ